MKLDTLKTKVEFDFVYKYAQKFFHKYFVLYAVGFSHLQTHHFKDKQILHTIRSRQADIYLGLSISRKIGKANKRNLLKRRIKAIVYENRLDYKHYILIIVAREGINAIDFHALKSHLCFAFSKIRKAYKAQNLRPSRKVLHIKDG